MAIDVYLGNKDNLFRRKMGTSPLTGVEIHRKGFMVRFHHRGCTIFDHRRKNLMYDEEKGNNPHAILPKELAVTDKSIFELCEIPIPLGHDLFECECGNTADRDGFFPCDADGSVIEPDKGKWDGKSYVCDRCDMVYIYNEEPFIPTRLVIHDLDNGRIYEVKSYDQIEPQHREAADAAMDVGDTVVMGRVVAQLIEDFMQ